MHIGGLEIQALKVLEGDRSRDYEGRPDGREVCPGIVLSKSGLEVRCVKGLPFKQHSI